MVQGGRIEPVWTPDGSALAYVDGHPDLRSAWRVDLESGEKRPLIDVERARAAVAEALSLTPPGKGVPFSSFEFAAPEAIRFEVCGSELTLGLSDYSVVKTPFPSAPDEIHELSEHARTRPRRFLQSVPLMEPAPALEVPSPDGSFLLSTHHYNIVCRSTVDGRALQLTDDGVEEHEWRLNAASLVYAKRGPDVCWAPDSRQVAAYRVDLRGVYRAPVVHYLKKQEEVQYRYRAQAGSVLERTTLYVLDLHGRPPVELELGDTTDTYPVSGPWLPDSSGLLILQLTRDCKQADVLLADAHTGRVRLLFSETGDSFVRIHHDIYYFSRLGESKLGLWLTPNGDEILWQSERSGWRHLYIYDFEGSLRRQLTDGEWAVDEVIGICDGYVYLTGRGNKARPYDVHLYRVPVEGGDLEPLTEAPGVHTVALAPSGAAFLDRHSTPARPPVVELRSASGRRLCELSRADISRLEEVGWTPPEEFTVTAADGETELWGVLFKPDNFDPSRRYPLLEYIYGGAHMTAVPHSFIEPAAFTPYGVQAQALAQLGYVTMLVDARGTPGRSKAFHDASYRWFANVLADDHAETVQQLAARYDFIDGARAGVIGHSAGGYAAFRCLADRPDVYKAAVCAAPSFALDGTILFECYLDLPQTNPRGYAFADPYQLAAKVEGEIMLAVGSSDGFWADTIKMSGALIRSGKPHEFVVLPEAYHSFDSVNDAYFWTKIAEFFARHLGDVSTRALEESEAVEAG
jgi:dipeptidyl aminopeptidase/acylaminoacyl peptidase